MEPLAKKSKCEQSFESEQLKLLDLNDHFLILEKILPDDMYSISLACKKLQNMAFDCFRLYHQSESLTVDYNYDNCVRNFGIRGTHYSRRFSKLIPNIFIQQSHIIPFQNIPKEEQRNCLRFVKLNCSAELK